MRASRDKHATRRAGQSVEPPGSGVTKPESALFDRLLTPQRSVGNKATGLVVQRQRHGHRSGGSATPSAPRMGTRFTHPDGARSPYRSLSAEFDGRRFTVRSGSTVLVDVDAQSGRPVSVRPGDASRCHGSTSESYTNNPRYVGITDYGPIPEGTYRFRAAEFGLFTDAEQRQMILGGQFTDPFGAALHGGDWGAGRSPLHPVRITPAPAGCGNTASRSGFYLHGGSLSGSSGCIDVGNGGIAALLPHLRGYLGEVTVTVRYAHPAPPVSRAERVIGGAVYPGQQNPTLMDRVRGAWDQLWQ